MTVDRRLPELTARLQPGDLVLVTADTVRSHLERDGPHPGTRAHAVLRAGSEARAPGTHGYLQ